MGGTGQRDTQWTFNSKTQLLVVFRRYRYETYTSKTRHGNDVLGVHLLNDGKMYMSRTGSDYCHDLKDREWHTHSAGAVICVCLHKYLCSSLPACYGLNVCAWLHQICLAQTKKDQGGWHLCLGQKHLQGLLPVSPLDSQILLNRSRAWGLERFDQLINAQELQPLKGSIKSLRQ